MSRKNKKKFKQQQAQQDVPGDVAEPAQSEMPVDDVSSEQSVNEAGAPEEVAAEEEMSADQAREDANTEPIDDRGEESEEEGDEPETGEPTEDDEPVTEGPKNLTDAEPKGFIGTYWMLMFGVLLATMGVAGVIMLRTNFIQVYIMGVSNPSPGIGANEAMAYAGSMIPFVIGLFTINYWGKHTVIPEGDATAVEAEAEIEAEEPIAEPEDVPEIPSESEITEEPPSETAEFGHEHLPPEHLTTVQKIKHLTMAYSQGKISEGLYNQNMARFEEELEAKPAKAELPTFEKDFGHEHLPPVHLSPEDKIDHLSKAYAQGRISKGLYERDLAKFEEELKREQLHMPPHHLDPQEKIDHLEDAYRMGRISKGTYEKNLGAFKKDIEAEQAKKAAEEPPELDIPRPKKEIDAEIPESASSEDDKTLMQLDSLLEEIESGNDTPEMREKLRKKKEESFEERILQEIEDLEDL
ncbi:MAG: hypothetical protein V1934_03695 [Methanobacteriota archaeon]